MQVLLIGSGGREHAMAWRLSQSHNLKKLYIAPGNGGTQALGENVMLDIMDNQAIGQFCIDHLISHVIVGPEAPLVNGIVNHFQSVVGLEKVKILGPDAEAAQLEGSKSYAKEFMADYNIPTAAYRSFSIDQIQDAKDFINSMSTPVVLKADGLAAGKGVIIAMTHAEANQEVEEMLSGKFGDASATVVVEEFLDGIEFSVFAVTDGKSFKILPIAKDYKRIGEGDTGLNTGGMGSISPVPFVDAELMAKVHTKIIEPTINGIADRGLNYKGFVFFGLIAVEGEPFVIEYNCRMGDPETQVVMMRLESDLMSLIDATLSGTLEDQVIAISDDYATAVIAVAGGYPGAYKKGEAIELNTDHCFHGGTVYRDGGLKSNGGRVLAMTGKGSSMNDALHMSYEAMKKVDFEGKNFRKDIGFDLQEYVV